MQEVETAQKQKRHPRLVFRRLSKGGGDLIDIAIATFVIASLITAVLSVAATYKHIRRTQLQNTATKLASIKIEELRNYTFTNPALNVGTHGPTAVTELPSGNLSYIVDTDDPPLGANLKYITVNVSWLEKGAPQTITLNTMFSQGGI